MPDNTPTLPPQLMRQLEIAAEKRAAGISWVAIATILNCKPKTAAAWPRKYPEIWQRLLREARAQHAEDAGNEALSLLRTRMRSNDEKLSLNAALKLIDHCPPAQASATRDVVDEYIANLDNREREELDAAIVASEDQP